MCFSVKFLLSLAQTIIKHMNKLYGVFETPCIFVVFCLFFNFKMILSYFSQCYPSSSLQHQEIEKRVLNVLDLLGGCLLHCSGTGANGLECEPVSALGGCVPFSMISREHNRPARQYCLNVVNHIETDGGKSFINTFFSNIFIYKCLFIKL